MKINALHELETAVILAQQSWTGLDWTDDEERTYVEEQAALAAEYGNDALECAREGFWADAVDALECAATCERTFGDDLAWGKPLAVARLVADSIAEIRAALDASTGADVDGQEILDYSILLMAVTESIDHTSTVKGLTVDAPPLAKRLLEQNTSLVSELVAIACAGGPGAITLM